MLGGGQRELFCAGLGGHLVQTQLIPELRQLNSREVGVNCSRSQRELLNASISQPLYSVIASQYDYQVSLSYLIEIHCLYQ